MPESLKHKTLKGTLWSSVERFSVQGVAFVVMIVMARILTPEDYGLVGDIIIFIAISQSLVDSGFSQALIRKQDRSEIDNSTVFYFNIAVGIILYLILFLCAPLIAQFYDEPILIPLTRVISLSVLLNSLVVVHRALLTVKIDFKTQAKASLTAAVVSGIVGIYMAYTGWGPLPDTRLSTSLSTPACFGCCRTGAPLYLIAGLPSASCSVSDPNWR